MTKTYVTHPSDNFAVREEQIPDYHPDLCFKLGQTHRAYDWSTNPMADWDKDQREAYLRGYREGASK